MRAPAIRAVGIILVFTLVVSPATVAACMAMCSAELTAAHHGAASASTASAFHHTHSTTPAAAPEGHTHGGHDGHMTEARRLLVTARLAEDRCGCCDGGAVLASATTATLKTDAGLQVRPPLVHTVLAALPSLTESASVGPRAFSLGPARPPVPVLVALRI